MKGVPRIQEFPCDDRYWQVDWFGAVEPNPTIPREPTIQVIISPFATTTIQNIPASKLASASSSVITYSEQKTISIGTGQLPALFVGSIWHNGELQRVCAGHVTEFEALDISEQTTKVLSASSKEHNQYIIPFTHYRFGKNGYFSKVIAIQHEGDPYGILIPMTELVRFYYAISTDLADIIFSGDLKHNLNSVLNLDHTWQEMESQRAVIGLRQRFSDQDGWILGRIMNSSQAWAGATAIHDEMMKNRFNGKPSHIKSAFPFNGTSNLIARCKPIPTQTPQKWRYLVLSLIRCSAAFPFRHLTIYRDNDNQRVKDGTDKPDDEKKPGWAGPRVVTGQPNKPFQSQQTPNKNSATELFNLPTDRFADIAGKKPDKPTKEQCEYKASTVSQPPTETNQLSSAQPDYSDSRTGTGRLNSTYERAKALPASFDTFVQAIEYLNTSDGFRAKVREPNEMTRYLPLTKPTESRQWAYLDSKTKERRQVLVGDINYQGCWFSLIEFEQRKTDKCRIGMTYFEDGRYISDTQITMLLGFIAEQRGIWSNIPDYQLNSLKIDSYKHVWPDTEAFSASITDKIRRILQC